MAQYTMELRELIYNNVDIFSFDFPIFDEKYRTTFKEKFIRHFYFREIGVETVERFKFNLQEKLNLIMPLYNKIYKSQALEQRILDNYTIEEKFEKSTNGTRTGVNEMTNKSLFSDTGRKRVDIDDVDYVSNISKDINNNTSNINDENAENWTRTMVGNIGIQTDADSIVKYENSLKNVDLLIFGECEDLFMQVF